MKGFFEVIGIILVTITALFFSALFLAWLFPWESDVEIKDNKMCQTSYEAFSLDGVDKCFEVKINVENYTMEEYYE